MQHGRVLLAGDAAHIVTPASGKGMNLALQDIDELVAGLLDHYRNRRRRPSRCLRRNPSSRRLAGPSSSRIG